MGTVTVVTSALGMVLKRSVLITQAVAKEKTFLCREKATLVVLEISSVALILETAKIDG